MFDDHSLPHRNDLEKNIDAGKQACELLSSISPKSVLERGTAPFERARYSYWSGHQAASYPQCIFQPANAGEVSLAVMASRLTGSAFGVKSGGHGSFEGQSGAPRGITIDLVKLNQIEVSPDRKTVTLGPGSRWLDVYTALEPLGLTVIGGRDANVGVGGFLLGGGISFLSSMHGWACDSISSYEIVLANGTVTTASQTENAELFKALRGGGSNFGIVTAFHLDAYPSQGMWGGSRVHPLSRREAVLQAFVNHAASLQEDPKASVIVNLVHEKHEWVLQLDLEYCAPEADAPTMREFMSIPATSDDTTVTSQSALTIEVARRAPRGYRNSFWAATVKADPQILQFYVNTFVAESEKILSYSGIIPAGDIQVIPPGQRRPMNKRGGNVLPLRDRPEESLWLLNPVFFWTDPAHDLIVYQTIRTILAKTTEEARRRGLENEFVYMNYASQFQNVVGSYGKESQEFLARVARKYDSQGLFQRTGGHKLHGVVATEKPWLNGI